MLNAEAAKQPCDKDASRCRILSQTFERSLITPAQARGNALADADAKRDEGALAAGLFELMESR
jgi:hypothetical protein